MTALRKTLCPWVDETPRYRQGEGRVAFKFRFQSEDAAPLTLKVETNTREHFATRGLTAILFEVQSRWHEGKTDIPGYELNELPGTRMRALCQRRKGRDLFDLAMAQKITDELTARLSEAA